MENQSEKPLAKKGRVLYYEVDEGEFSKDGRKKNMKKKFIIAGMIFTMVAGLTACNQKEEGKSETSQIQTTVEEASSDGTGKEETTSDENESVSATESETITEMTESETESAMQLSEEDAALLQSYLGGELDVAAVKNLTDENKKKIQKEAKDNGYIVEFDQNNKVTIKDEDGQPLTAGKTWPENEYTEGFPKMNKGRIVNTTVSKTDGTVITMEGVTVDDATSYVRKVRKAGYRIDQSEMSRFSEEDSYYFEAKNKNGYQTMIILSNKKFVITIIQADNVEK